MSFDGEATVTARSNSVSDWKLHNHGVASKKQGREKANPSARQYYLRSYAFKKKETVPQKAKNCLIRVKDTVALRWKKKDNNGSSVRRRSRCWGLRRAKVTAFSSKATSFFRRVLSCPAKLGNNNDTVDQGMSREKSSNNKSFSRIMKSVIITKVGFFNRFS